MKLKSVYVCSNCGETSPRWMGRCPSCGSWNTMNEDVVAEAPKAGTPAARQAAAARQEGVTTLTPGGCQRSAPRRKKAAS